MSTIKENIKCIGCGSPLQTKDKDAIGFTPKKIEETKYCKRCFRLINHLEKPTVYSSNEEFIKIIDKISNEDCLIVYLMDYFDFHGSSVKIVEDKIKNKDYLIVGNKMDLLPKSVKERKLELWFNSKVKEKGLEPIETLLISAKKKKKIDELIEIINEERKGRNVYVVGATNTGKSTLINGIISAITMENQEIITTSFFSSTTLDTIEIPFDKTSSLIDTPGIINEGQMTNYLDKDSLEIIVAKKEIHPKTYNLNSEQTLFMTGLCQFNFLKGEKTSFTVYVSNDIEIHRTKLEKAEVLRETHMCTEMLYPPTKKEYEKIPKFETKKISITESDMDIVIDGFGWIAINRIYSPLEIEVIVPEKISVTTRKSLI